MPKELASRKLQRIYFAIEIGSFVITGRNEVGGQGYVFTGVYDSVHREVSA